MPFHQSVVTTVLGIPRLFLYIGNEIITTGEWGDGDGEWGDGDAAMHVHRRLSFLW